MSFKKTKLIGKEVNVPNYDGELTDWGIIVGYDGEYYHIALFGDKNTILVFERNEIRIPHKKRKEQ